jgi:phospholipid transport system substrate-binding protein
VSKNISWLFAVALAILAFTGASSAFAGAATDIVRSKQTTLFDLLRQPSPDNQKIGVVFDDMLDYQALTEGSLGSEWAPRTDAEKTEFSDLLKQLVRKAYERNLRKIVNYDVEYTGEEPADSAVMVKTRAKSKSDAREEPVEITFKVIQKDGKWKVQDIVTEGVSLVSSYRGQFTKIIKSEGFAALIKKMKDKLAKGDV